MNHHYAIELEKIACKIYNEKFNKYADKFEINLYETLIEVLDYYSLEYDFIKEDVADFKNKYVFLENIKFNDLINNEFNTFEDIKNYLNNIINKCLNN